MKHLFWTSFLGIVIAGLGMFTVTHPNHDESKRLKRELAHIQAQNAELERQNAQLEVQVVALRDDPRLAQRRARAQARLAKPHELIFQFEPDRAPSAVSVTLHAGPGQILLAGKPLRPSEVTPALNQLHKRLPKVTLGVEFDPMLDEIAKQRIRDFVAASTLAGDAS